MSFLSKTWDNTVGKVGKKIGEAYNKFERGLTGRGNTDKNIKEAEKQRQWEEYMSNTAHQREVADLEAAGLNPILSATGGNGASSGAGASAQASQPSGAESINAILGAISNIKNAMTSAKSSHDQGKLINSQMTDIADQIFNRDRQTAKHLQELDANIKRIEAQTLRDLEETKARKQKNDENEDLGLTDNDTGPTRTIAKTKKQAQEKGDSLYEKTKIGAQNLKLKAKLAIQSKKAENEFRQKVKNKLTNNEIVEYNKAILTKNNKKQMQYVRLAKSRGAF